jgi:hypothetical protein
VTDSQTDGRLLHRWVIAGVCRPEPAVRPAAMDAKVRCEAPGGLHPHVRAGPLVVEASAAVVSLLMLQPSPQRIATPHVLTDPTETNRTQLVLFDMQNRTFGPYLVTINRILVPVMRGRLTAHMIATLSLRLSVQVPVRALCVWCPGFRSMAQALAAFS